MKRYAEFLIVSKLINAVVLASTCLLSSQLAAASWSTNGKYIVDSSGISFVFRGVTINHFSTPERTVQAIKDAASLGANSVQIEIAANFYGPAPVTTGQQLTEIIQACKTNKVICVLEPNDVAGYPGAAGSISPSAISSYWSFSDVRQAIMGQQDYVVIGIGNQALGTLSTEEYISRMSTYVGEFRSSLPGFLLLVDGSDWGQDTDKAMLKFAEQNRLSNSLSNNVIYSVDLYDAYLFPEKADEYITRFSAINAPLVIGGLAPTSYYHPHNIAPRPAVAYDLREDVFMFFAQEYRLGFFGRGWSGNQNPALDVVNDWNVNSLTNWGSLLFNGFHGIKRSAKQASIFNSVSSSSSSNSSAAYNHSPAVLTGFYLLRAGCGQIYGNASVIEYADPDGDSANHLWEVTGNANKDYSTNTYIRFYMKPYQNYTIKVTTRDSRGASNVETMVQNHSYNEDCTGISSSSSSLVIIPPNPTSFSSSSSSSHSASSTPVLPSSISASSRSSAPTKGNCTYVVNSQWNNGFTAVIRIKNTSNSVINGWDINWQYSDGSKVTNLWSANVSGANPYNAKNLNWNSTIQPGQTIEFGFQGSKPAGAASVPVVTGNICQ